MLRTRAARKQPGDHDCPRSPHNHPSTVPNQGDDDSRGRAKAFLPRSASLTLTLFLIGAIVAIYFRVSTTVRRNKLTKSGEKLEVTSLSVPQPKSGLKGQSKSSFDRNINPKINTDKKNTLNDLKNIYSPATNRTLHVIFSTDWYVLPKNSSSRNSLPAKSDLFCTKKFRFQLHISTLAILSLLPLGVQNIPTWIHHPHSEWVQTRGRREREKMARGEYSARYEREVQNSFHPSFQRSQRCRNGRSEGGLQVFQ